MAEERWGGQQQGWTAAGVNSSRGGQHCTCSMGSSGRKIMSSSSLDRSSRSAAHRVADSRMACAAGGHCTERGKRGDRREVLGEKQALQRERE